MCRKQTKDHINNVEVIKIKEETLRSSIGSSSNYQIKVIVSKTELVKNQVFLTFPKYCVLFIGVFISCNWSFWDRRSNDCRSNYPTHHWTFRTTFIFTNANFFSTRSWTWLFNSSRDYGYNHNVTSDCFAYFFCYSYSFFYGIENESK